MYQFKRVQIVKTDMETCWQFFSAPGNLQLISPAYMGFEILTQVPDTMYEGLIISYKVAPLFGLPVNWVTEITRIVKHSYFIDEQRDGPYRLWHHEHHFRQVDAGIEMTDLVSYVVPLGAFGMLLHPVLIYPKLKEIFDYRQKAIDKIFS